MISQAGAGRHIQYVMSEEPEAFQLSLKLLYILDWFYVPSNMLSRVAVVALFLRIFTSKTARICCQLVMAFLVGNCVATIIAAQLECTPLAFTWDKSIPGGHCFDQITWYQVANLPNVIADVCILCLPIRPVWTLKASIARKAGIAFVCLTGSMQVCNFSNQTQKLMRSIAGSLHRA